MMSDPLDRYVKELRRELRLRGFLGQRTVREAHDHILDAAQAEEMRGTPRDVAVQNAIERFGRPRAVAIAFASEQSLVLERKMLVFAIAFGVLLGFIDSLPTWDDTGVTAGVLLLATAILGMASPHRAWMWALSVGCWIPLFGIATGSNYGSVIALVVAFAGAYAGKFVRRVVVSG